eukprot:2242662-Amphidinium_carterae.1
MREAELLTARERDQYYEQLVATTVPQGIPATAQASPTPPQQVPPPPQVIPPQVPPAQAAGTPGMQQPC